MRRGFKPLLPLLFADGARGALEAVVKLYRGAGIENILVVSGLREEEIAREAERLGIAHAHNLRAEQGMFSSVCAGLAGLTGLAACARCFVHPVDIPLVRPLTIDALLEQARRKPQAALVPTWKGEEGHPPLLPAALFSAISNYDGPGGLRGALEHPPRLGVPTADANILRDMDTDEDYDAACLCAGRAHLLEPEEAEELLRLRGTGERGLAHARSVAAVAVAFAAALNNVGFPLDPRLAETGGLLHDLCKGQAQHEAAAGEALRALHLPALAPLVEGHRDCMLAEDAPVTEKELIYLADKYVYGDRLVTIEQRFGQKLERFAGDEAACAAIRGRLARALALERRFGRESGLEAFATARAALETLRA